MYPLLPWITGAELPLTHCIPLAPQSYFVIAFLVSLATIWLLISTGMITSATSVLLYQAVCGGSYGVWLVVVSLPVQLCSDLAIGPGPLRMIAGGACVVTAAVFFFYQRQRIEELIRINPTVFDFAAMRFWMLRPVLRPDGKSNSGVAELMWVGGLMGLLIGKIPFSNLIDVRISIQAAGFAFISWFVGYFYVGFLAVGQVYLALLVSRRGRQAGQSMLVGELSNG